jgi:hypothetical protein
MSGPRGTARALAAHLSLQGYRTRARPGQVGGEPFTGNMLRHLLSSPTYAGYLTWHHRADKRDRGETGEQVRGSWEPLWPESVWRRIQEVRQRQFRGSAGGRQKLVHPFRRVAVCDRCDHRLIGEGHRVASGEVVPYLTCSTQREPHECDQRGVRSGVLEDQRSRWLATLADGAPQPSYFEADLVNIKDTLYDWARLWDRATPQERADIMSAVFSRVRVRDQSIVVATLADQHYAPIIASSEAHRIGLEAAASERQTDALEHLAGAPGRVPGSEQPTGRGASRRMRERDVGAGGNA